MAVHRCRRVVHNTAALRAENGKGPPQMRRAFPPPLFPPFPLFLPCLEYIDKPVPQRV